ncbi:MAG: alpha/beta fold hydrolase [Hydrogenophilaceae bacterium]|nr:alpha/beta fold hydrolase [Hydrogenophilaceae bacterium]
MADESENLEETVCGFIKEPFVFWTWNRLAGKPDLAAAGRMPNAEAITHQTRDGRLLHGYRLKSARPGSGFVLVAQGNAMLADQLLPELGLLAQAGLEVYVFDYRGYGQSEGKRRLKAMVSDYRELFDRLAAANPGPRYLYGISFGGIVLLNLVGSGVAFDRAVIDSTPSRLSNYGCPEKYDPVVNLPQDASRFLIVAGGRDMVVPPKDSRELRDLVKSRGGRVELEPDFTHPFMDADFGIHRARLESIKSFLLGPGEAGPPSSR